MNAKEVTVLKSGSFVNIPPTSASVGNESVGVDCARESLENPQACFAVCSVLTGKPVTKVEAGDFDDRPSNFPKFIRGTMLSANLDVSDAVSGCWLRSLSWLGGDAEDVDDDDNDDAGAVCSMV